jgi:hypothetical protein
MVADTSTKNVLQGMCNVVKQNRKRNICMHSNGGVCVRVRAVCVRVCAQCVCAQRVCCMRVYRSPYTVNHLPIIIGRDVEPRVGPRHITHAPLQKSSHGPFTSGVDDSEYIAMLWL